MSKKEITVQAGDLPKKMKTSCSGFRRASKGARDESEKAGEDVLARCSNRINGQLCGVSVDRGGNLILTEGQRPLCWERFGIKMNSEN